MENASTAQIWTTEDCASLPSAFRYRAEWIGDRYIERITLPDGMSKADGTILPCDAQQFISEPACELVRFWLMGEEQVIVKVYGSCLATIGYFIPVVIAFSQQEGTLATEHLYLSLWLDSERRVTVTGEHAFDKAASNGGLSADEIEQAERSIRRLTTALADRRLPTGFVRSFEIVSSEDVEDDIIKDGLNDCDC